MPCLYLSVVQATMLVLMPTVGVSTLIYVAVPSQLNPNAVLCNL